MNEELLISTKGRIGYKGFDVKDDGTLYCRNKTYKVGEIATITGKLEICHNGIHFCWNICDVDNHYRLRDHIICEVEPLGEIIAHTDGKKCCTDKIKIIRMLTSEEVLKLSNSGKGNTSYCNTGDYNTDEWNEGHRNTGSHNTGDWNAGDWNAGNCNTGGWNEGNRNTGDRNTGDWNTGDRNAGNCNTGDWNTGDWNAGNRNTGDCNTGGWNAGNCNTGDWNVGNNNAGFFNTIENKCFLFDAPSDMTPTQFRASKYYKAICSSSFILTEWVDYTYKEKEADKAKRLAGGYLKVYSYKTACANWWKKMSEENKEIIKSMPNFDAKKFKKITGIDVDKEKPTKE